MFEKCFAVILGTFSGLAGWVVARSRRVQSETQPTIFLQHYSLDTLLHLTETLSIFRMAIACEIILREVMITTMDMLITSHALSLATTYVFYRSFMQLLQ